MKSDARLFQPNLMCSFHRTRSADSRIMLLTGVNKDAGVGIIDEQIISAIWSWCLSERERFINSKTKAPLEAPKMDVTLAMNTNGSVFNVMVFSLDEKLGIDDYSFAGAIAVFCKGVNKHANFNLDLGETKNGTNGPRISP